MLRSEQVDVHLLPVPLQRNSCLSSRIDFIWRRKKKRNPFERKKSVGLSGSLDKIYQGQSGVRVRGGMFPSTVLPCAPTLNSLKRPRCEVGAPCADLNFRIFARSRFPNSFPGNPNQGRRRAKTCGMNGGEKREKGGREIVQSFDLSNPSGAEFAGFFGPRIPLS